MGEGLDAGPSEINQGEQSFRISPSRVQREMYDRNDACENETGFTSASLLYRDSHNLLVTSLHLGSYNIEGIATHLDILVYGTSEIYSNIGLLAQWNPSPIA